jgi:hypothetical protein
MPGGMSFKRVRYLLQEVSRIMAVIIRKSEHIPLGRPEAAVSGT